MPPICDCALTGAGARSAIRRLCGLLCTALIGVATPIQAQTNAKREPRSTGNGGPIVGVFTFNSETFAALAGSGGRPILSNARIGAIFDADLQRLIGWTGATAHASVHAIYGTGLRGDRIRTTLAPSGLEARPALRLFNLWIEAPVAAATSLRVGQFTAGQEFAISDGASMLVNSTFGWPASFSSGLPSGGPTYPLAAPGIRLAWQARGGLFHIAAFAGDPAGPGQAEPQKRDRFGLNGFRFAKGAFVIAEFEAPLARSNYSKLKIGAWAHSARFADLRQGGAQTNHLTGQRAFAGNTALYAILDARLLAERNRSVDTFARLTLSPGSRNPVSRYADFGFRVTGLAPGRPSDILMVGAALARHPRRSSTGKGEQWESVIEVSYLISLSRRCTIQPDVQLIRGYNETYGAGSRSPGALVAGLRFVFRRE
jgi:porin